MSRSALRSFSLRPALIAGGTALLVVLPVAPALAATSALPTITAVAPLPTHVGKTLTITGSGFEVAPVSVALGSAALTAIDVVNDGTLTATVPPGATSGDLTVTTAAGPSGPFAVTVLPTPQKVDNLAYVIDGRGLTLSWTGGGDADALVQDVTDAGSPRTVAVQNGSGQDKGFTNTAPKTYAVWGRDSDGTTSDEATTVTVTPVDAVATTLTMGLSTAKARYGASYQASGTLRRAGVPLAGQRVQLLAKVGGSTATNPVRTLTTDAHGVVRTRLVETRSVALSLRFAGDAFSQPAASSARVVALLPTLTAAFRPAVVVRPETTVFSGRLPAALPGATVKVQRKITSGWGTLTTVKTDARGGWSYTFAPGKPGSYSYRAVLNGGPGWLGTLSPARTLNVQTRNLSAGLSGDDVLLLKRQLAALRYVPGALNRSFDYDLTHAVMAFQKVERLPVTGRWTRTERVRIGKPHAWTLRAPGSGRAVEIDIKRQVLVLSEAGKVRMIVDVSTGTERAYTYKGEKDVAHTPRGRFSILRKIDGIRVSKLGELYRPSYFYQGWAIHGSGSVPNYPASHGCVRITDPNADRLFPLLVKGTPVTLYDT
jgi:hypothetical protein